MNFIDFDEKKEIGKNLFAIRVNYKWGLINENNDILMRIVYDYISFENGQIWANYKGFKFVVPMEMLPMKYDCIYEFNTYSPDLKLAKVALNSKIGIANENLDEIIKCEYDSFNHFKSAFWLGKCVNNKSYYDVFSYTGALLSSGYENEYLPYKHIVKKTVGDSCFCGIIDNHSFEVIPCENRSIKIISENQYSQRKKDKKEIYIYDIENKNQFHFLFSSRIGLIDKGYINIKEVKLGSYNNGQKIYFAYRNVSYPHFFEESIIPFSKTSDIIDVYDKDVLVLSYSPNTITPKAYIGNSIFICESIKDKKYTIVSNRAIISPFIYDSLEYDEYKHIFVAVRDSKFTEVKYETYELLQTKPVIKTRKEQISGTVDIFDDTGKLLLLDINYKNFDIDKCGFCEGYLRIRIQNILYVFFNGKLIASSLFFDKIDSFLLEFKSGFSFSGPYADLGYAKVKIGEKWGVVNSNGEMLISAVYDKIEGICNVTIKKEDPYNRKQCKKSDKPLLLKATYQDKYHLFTADINLKKIHFRYICQERINNFFVYSFNDISMSLNNIDDLKFFVQQSKEKYNFGLIDSKGSIVLDSINSLDTVLDFVKDKTQEELWDSKCPECVIVKDFKTNKVGLFNNDNQQICEYKFDSISEFNEEGLAITYTEGEGNGIINKFGEIILPCKYLVYTESNMQSNCAKIHRYRFYFNEGYLTISENNKFGLINKSGHIVIPCKYPQIESFTNFYHTQLLRKGYVTVKENDRFGLIKLSNASDYLLDTKYESIILYSNDKYISEDASLLFDKCEKYIIANRKQEELIIEIKTGKIIFSINDYKFSGFYLITKSFVAARLEEDGQYIIRFFSLDNPNIHKDYSDIGFWSDKYAQVCQDSKWGVFDLNTGKEIIPCNYEATFINKYSNIFTIKFNGKYGFINIFNGKSIPCTYTKVHDFKNGFAAIYRDSKWHFIDETGTIIAGDFDEVLDFNENYAAVRRGEKWGYVNSKGQIAIPFRFTKAHSFSEGLAAVAFKVRYGYIDKYNRTIIPFKYDSAYGFRQGIASVFIKDGGSGSISKDGEKIDWEYPKYDSYSDDYDYDKETWYALTEGMYGDYPGGDIDYDIFGF